MQRLTKLWQTIGNINILTLWLMIKKEIVWCQNQIAVQRNGLKKYS